ncbi:hypothetical protein [Saccharothrix australiensis]|nr:hypothetical protein [Saccharothrix australiensis]
MGQVVVDIGVLRGRPPRVLSGLLPASERSHRAYQRGGQQESDQE